MPKPKVSVYCAISLDGYIAREDGGLDWLDRIPETPGEDYGFKEFMDSIDLLVMGRNTYEKVMSFGKWPYAGKRVIILSHSLSEVIDEAELCSGSLDELLSRLQDEGVNHVYIDGGKTVSQFLDAGLVDQMILTVVPTLLGSGIPLFNRMENERNFKLISTQSYPTNLIQLRYEALS